jgi:Flp pilus assembly protein TadD
MSITAISKYRQAAKITPNDPAPYGNLSAAYLEVGQYKTASFEAATEDCEGKCS